MVTLDLGKAISQNICSSSLHKVTDAERVPSERGQRSTSSLPLPIFPLQYLLLS